MAQKKVKRHPGAIKAHRQSLVRNLRNKLIKKGLRLANRAVLDAASAKNSGEVDKLIQESYSVLDKAAKRGTIHWKTAARRKSRLVKSARLQLSAAAPAPAR